MEARLKTSLWLAALLRTCDRRAIPCAVLRRGDNDAGAVLLKHNWLDGRFEVWGRERDGLGRLVWRSLAGSGGVAEAAVEAFITRQVTRDPDLWVVEIEDRAGRLPELLPE